MPKKKTPEDRIHDLEKTAKDLHIAVEKMQLQQEEMLDLISLLVGEVMNFASHQSESWDKMADLADGMLPD